MRMWVRSLALFSGLRIRCCCKLWYSLQTRLGSHIALVVVQASWQLRLHSTPSLGTSICHRCGAKKAKKKINYILIKKIFLKQEKKKICFEKFKGDAPWWLSGLKFRCCHYCDLGHCYDTGSIPGPGNFHILEAKKKKTSKEK